MKPRQKIIGPQSRGVAIGQTDVPVKKHKLRKQQQWNQTQPLCEKVLKKNV